MTVPLPKPCLSAALAAQLQAPEAEEVNVTVKAPRGTIVTVTVAPPADQAGAIERLRPGRSETSESAQNPTA